MSFSPTIIDQGLETYLAAALGVPVYPAVIPQGVSVYPCLVYTMIYQVPQYTLSQAGGLVDSSYQIDVWGDDALNVETLNDSLRSSLESYKGLMGNVYVSGCRMVDSSQDFEATTYGSDQGFFRILTEWQLWYAETIPQF